jgi:glucosamine--fructose-6-phosphate aminotransferase (isomerizing)
MCGIVGVVGNQNAVSIILDGLKKLEYRGYDSAGIAIFNKGKFEILKEEGKISKLESLVKRKKPKSNIGIGHTRWATHGRPSKENAHPHASKKVCLVHNGIIENYQELKQKLEKSDVKFLSQTDTEILPHLIELNFKKDKNIQDALISSAKEIEGMFALAIMFEGREDLIAVAKRGSPIIIGVGENCNYVASDYYALNNYTNKIITLDDNEFAIISAKKIEIFDEKKNILKKEIKVMESDINQASRGEYKHFMLKEIHEQPEVLQRILENYVDVVQRKILFNQLNFDPKKINKITIVACGTSYYAGLCGKYILEKIAKIEVEVDIASEFRYRSHPFREDNLMIFISQSGETADTLAALKYAKKNNQKILSIVNVGLSSMAQLSDSVLNILAGLEIGVASTKAYTAQVAILSLLAIHFADKKSVINQIEKSNLITEFADCIKKISNLFEKNDIRNIKKIARFLVSYKNILYVGRSVSQITSFEAALKLRELSYINAQGIAAGELKHGTIALIDKKIPVIVIAPHNKSDDLFEKTVSNAEEINARGGKIIFVSDKKGVNKFNKMATKKIEIPEISGVIQEAIIPVVSTQLLAYYVSLYKGNDVDQPRNLAKSVTVE